MKYQKEAQIFLNTVYKQIGKRGVDNFLSDIKRIDIFREQDNNNEKISEFIFSKILVAYQITRTELIDWHKTGKRGKITEAREMTFVLLYKHLHKITEDEISSLFNRDYKLVSRAKKKYNSMDANNKFDKPILDIYQTIHQQTIDFKNKFKK